MECRLRRHYGQYRWVSDNGVPHYTQNGVFEGYIGSCTDITENKEYEQQKDDFIRMASHELKTPITSIKGYVQFLLKTATSTDPPLLTNSLASIDKQVSKLTRLISDLLDLTKVDSKDFTLNKEVFNMNELVKEAVA